MFNRTDWAKLLNDLEEQVNEEVDIKISRLSNDALDKKTKELREKRSNLTIDPAFTPIVVSISQQILAFGMAGLGLVIAFFPNILELSAFWIKTISLVGLFYVDMMLISIIIIIWFLIQARTRFHFLYLKKLGNTIPYYYYETLKRKKRWSPIQNKKQIYNRNIDYLDDLKKYVNYSANEDKKTIYKNELLQNFLMINYQGYLDQFEMQLDGILIYGLLSSFGSIIVLNFMI